MSAGEKTTAGALPNRPRLARGIGAYRRADDEIQVGLDPELAVVVPGLPPRVVRLVCELDGRPLRTVLQRAGEDADTLRDLLGKLARRGLVVDAREPSGDREWPWELRSGDHGRPSRAATTRIAIHGHGPIAAGVTALLGACGIGRVQAVPDGTLPLPSGIDLVVLTDVAAVAPEVVNALMGDRLAHLPVRVRDGIGIVGPLVLPGRTSCLSCADLHRTDRDPRWPVVSCQIAGVRQHTGPASGQAVAALAVAQIHRVLRPGDDRPPLWNATMELDLYAGRIRDRAWHPHPRCTCGAADHPL